MQRVRISWEGDSLQVLRGWPKQVRGLFGGDLEEMQEGRTALLPVRPMTSIAAGVFELKASDERKWYRMIYLARVDDTVYVLHCFTKASAKTDRRDLDLAEQRWKLVQRRLREERKREKKK